MSSVIECRERRVMGGTTPGRDIAKSNALEMEKEKWSDKEIEVREDVKTCVLVCWCSDLEK